MHELVDVMIQRVCFVGTDRPCEVAVETGLIEMRAVIRSLRERLRNDEDKECRKQLSFVRSLPTVTDTVAGC